ncbi:MAG: nucleotidyltransferase [Candidatus Thiodiazotropha taylori]
MNIDQQQNPSEALQWIVSLLNEHRIPFLICGGLAAIAYGSKRDLNDIDLFVPGELFKKVVLLGSEHIRKPPQRYCEAIEGWDLEYVQFIYCGVKIEVGNPNGAKIFDQNSDKWTSLEMDFLATESRYLLGTEIPLMNRAALIEYKRKLGRPVDLLDIASIR